MPMQPSWGSPVTSIRPRTFTSTSRREPYPRTVLPAGVTVCTAMVSALTGQTVRQDVAMTGEISLRGRVMPIGGLKEKTMAAMRHGIHTVVIPEDNVRDLEENRPDRPPCFDLCACQDCGHGAGNGPETGLRRRRQRRFRPSRRRPSASGSPSPALSSEVRP